MEAKYQISPNVVIPAVTWDIKREVSRASWGPETGVLEPDYLGEDTWEPDDLSNDDEDLTQNVNLKDIFEIDGPGYDALPYTANFRFSKKAKFQDWVEVKIGSHWYVCSGYKNWRMIMHVKYDGTAGHWVKDDAKTNEVVEGTIEGWAGTWNED
jgi:hypothetical protein